MAISSLGKPEEEKEPKKYIEKRETQKNKASLDNQAGQTMEINQSAEIKNQNQA